MEMLTPIGRFKGELNGQYESFYAATDRKGSYFINHNMSYSPEAYVKSDDWKEISKEQYQKYKDTLHLMSSSPKRIKR